VILVVQLIDQAFNLTSMKMGEVPNLGGKGFIRCSKGRVCTRPSNR
jgi:hypothetical protein